VSTPPLVDFRAPRTWIFLSSLQEAFFSTLLEQIRAHAQDTKRTNYARYRWWGLAHGAL